MKKEAKLWKRKNADQRVKRTFKTADEVLKARAQATALLPATRGSRLAALCGTFHAGCRSRAHLTCPAAAPSPCCPFLPRRRSRRRRRRRRSGRPSSTCGGRRRGWSPIWSTSTWRRSAATARQARGLACPLKPGLPEGCSSAAGALPLLVAKLLPPHTASPWPLPSSLLLLPQCPCPSCSTTCGCWWTWRKQTSSGSTARFGACGGRSQRGCRRLGRGGLSRSCARRPIPPTPTHHRPSEHPLQSRHEKDTAVILGKEQERLKEEAEAAAAAAERLEHVLSAVARAHAEPLRCACRGAAPWARLGGRRGQRRFVCSCIHAVSWPLPAHASTQSERALSVPASPRSLEEVHQAYSELRAAYREEYLMYGLGASALAQVSREQWSREGA